MDISGTLHLYSGRRAELFFVFDDGIAQILYDRHEFDVDDRDTRRAYVSVGSDRFIHERTLSFSRKQSEIKVSLCTKGSKNGLGALTALYDWFVPKSGARPAPLQVLGTLTRESFDGRSTWELTIEEPLDLVVPPGLGPRKKAMSPT